MKLLNLNEDKIPVTIITGFLGSGKTTLLNHILNNPNGKKYAVIVNEFGEIGIDNDMVIGVDEEVFELNNGCVCCNVRGDLIRILNSLFRRKNSFDAILVETTGLANPAPIAQTFFAEDDIARKSQLDAIISVVDAVHILKNLQEFEEATNQIAFADIIILNKIDEVDNQTLLQIKAKINSINCEAKIIETNKAVVENDKIIGIFAFLPDALNNNPAHHDNQHHHHGHHHHNNDVESLSLSTDRPLNEGAFTAYLSKIVDDYGADILRFKGIINIENEAKKFVFNGVHMMVEANYTDEWKPNEAKNSRAVFIGKNLPKSLLEKGFLACQS